MSIISIPDGSSIFTFTSFKISPPIPTSSNAVEEANPWLAPLSLRVIKKYLRNKSLHSVDNLKESTVLDGKIIFNNYYVRK